MPATAGTAPPRPTHLRVEYRREPEGVDPATRPRLSWRLPTATRGASQSAYRIVVGRRREAVAEGRGDRWDSGRVDSSRATDVAYDGPPLAADATYFWSVRVRTDDGEWTGWADPARFSTALRPEDWRGEWISHQPEGGDAFGWRSQWQRPDSDADPWVQVDLGATSDVGSVVLHPASPTCVVRTPEDYAVVPSWDEDPLEDFGFPDGYRIEVADDPAFDDPTIVGSADDARSRDGDSTELGGGDDRVHDDLGARGRYLRVTATDCAAVTPYAGPDDSRRTERVGPWECFALAGLTVRDESGTALAQGQPVDASSSVDAPGWGPDLLVDGRGDSRVASSAPLLRTEFALDAPVERARAHVAAVGYGELYCNGERIGDRRLDPAWTDYEHRVLYATYDVTDALSEGENAMGLWLGRGWFSKIGAKWAGDGSPRARAVVTVELADGTVRRVVTGEDWRAAASPIVANDVYDGERYDARREQPGWSRAGFDDAGWDAASQVAAPGGSLRPQSVEPMAVVETRDVEAVRDHPDGPILDFGQNLTGWVEIDVVGAAAGDEIELRHAEALADGGGLSRTDLRTADATDTYVARGDDRETYEPRFTYHGFRYAQIVGYPGDLEPADVTAKVVHTAMDRRGAFDCSDDDLAAVQHNAAWGLRGNTHSIPEDCPQRDERYGWTGDAQIAARSLLFNFDASRLHAKWLRDHDDAASSMGYVPDVIPSKVDADPGDPTWTVTRVLLPWHVYRHDGDRGLLEEHYEGMCAYADYWHSVTVDGGVIPEAYGKYGDWLAFENTDGRRGLPHDLFDTAFHYHVTDVLARIADVLGNDADARHYRDRAASIADAFHDRFYEPDAGVYGPGTQSALAVPLFVGLVPEDEVDRVVANLAAKVRADGTQLRTGFLGTRPLLHALADHGHEDLAYRIVASPDRPGWVYQVRQGATTVWERWDSDDRVGSGMNSLNHSPFTHVSEFFFEVLAGIRVGDRPLTETVTVAPSLVEDLDWVEASVETRNGDLAVAWQRTGDGGYDVSVTVPWNVEATVRLPDAVDATVLESGVAVRVGDGTANRDDVDDPAGVRRVAVDGDDVAVYVGTGSYEFEVR